MPDFRLGSIKSSRSYLLLVAFLVLLFLFGGGSRADIQSLIFLRPLAAMALVLAIATLKWQDVLRYRWLCGIAAAIFVVTALHLAPLPPTVWQALPERDLVAQIDQAIGLEGAWRPLSIAPPQTENALFALCAPLAVLLMMIRLNRQEQERLLVPILILGGISALTGLLQVAGGPASRFYFYDVSNFGSAVGLFANRNHQAAFMATLFPMLAVYASQTADSVPQARFRTVLAGVAAAILVPLLLVTGSRSGLALCIMGLAGAALLFKLPGSRTAVRRQGARKFPVLPVALGAMSIALMGVVTILSSRAESVSRLLQRDEVAELRVLTFGPVLEMIGHFLPWGSGVGTFVEAFQRFEPEFMLQPTYFNHAHNDYLEVVLTGGLPAAALLMAALAWTLVAGLRAWRGKMGLGHGTRLARLGSVIVALLAVASVVDYPLRTPSLSVLLVIAAVWMAGRRASAAGERDVIGRPLERSLVPQ